MKMENQKDGISFIETAKENILLQYIRDALSGKSGIRFPSNEFSFSFNPEISQVYITLFEPGQRPLRWGARKSTLENTISWIVKRLKEQPRMDLFHIEEPLKCRIMFETVIESFSCNIRNLTAMSFIKDRFEPGVTGLKIVFEDQTRFFMPTDAVTYSIMTVKQLLNFMYKRFKFTNQTKSKSERVHLMRRLPIKYTLIKSKAFVTYEHRTLLLRRGLPVISDFSKKDIRYTVMNALQWLLDNQNKDGSFLYYYDPVKDSIVDFLHPNQILKPYNNILRHSGGTIALLKGYEFLKEDRYLEAAKSSIGFFISTLREHKYKGKYACYPFFNKKSKLGGAGIGLVALIKYYQLSGDDSFMEDATGLVRHILSRVEMDGEMVGYYIHPNYNDGKPIINIGDKMKKELFSFYYPGEALLGLALYYKNANINDAFKEEIAKYSKLALDFLIEHRPVKYHYLFESLPSDAWLMQAIEEWIKVKGFNKKSYIDFVYDDMQKMFDHMYQPCNTSSDTKDYIGGFFYNYGDHVYHDASRNEGIVAAYNIAKFLNDKEKESYILTHMILSAKALMMTYHSPESSYAHMHPRKSIGAFRFKLTRQWMRVDSVQHAVCFFYRLYETGFDENDIDISSNTFGFIDGYPVIKKLASSGFSNVFLVEDKKKPYRKLALKLIKNENFLTSLANIEASILEKIDGEKNIIGYYGKKHFSNGVYFLFDYINNVNLNRGIKENRSFSNENAIELMLAMVKILEMLRKKKILHLDIKPANILFDKQKFYLIDWGLAREGDCFSTYYLKGNPIYIAPEVYHGVRCASSEIYSLGCTLYELLTGHKIFGLKKSDSIIVKMYHHLYDHISLEEVTSNKLKYILEKMLNKNPEKRIDLAALKSMLSEDESKFDSLAIKKEKTKTFEEYSNKALLDKMVADRIPYAELLLAQQLMERDDSKSTVLSLLERAAARLPIAELELGVWYYKHQRYEDAYYIFDKNKEHLNAKATYYLGCLYQLGNYVKQDTKKGLKLLYLAHKSNYGPASKIILELQNKQ